MNKGIHKALGVNVTEVANKIFSVNGNGQIVGSEFLIFWYLLMSVDPEKDVADSAFLETLIKQLEGRLRYQYGATPKDDDKKKDKKDKKDKKGDKDKNFAGDRSIESVALLPEQIKQFENPNTFVNINSLVTTLSFLLFTPFRFDPNHYAQFWSRFTLSDYALAAPECVKNLSTFIKFRCGYQNTAWEGEKILRDEGSRFIFDQLTRTTERDSTTGAAPDPFAPLINLASRTMTTAFSTMLSLDDGDITSSESAFIYTYLHDVISEHGKRYHVAVLNSLIDRAQLISQGGTQQCIREHSFLAICHMVRTFFTKDAVTNVSLLRRALVSLQSYYMWQQPYGKVAEQLIVLIQLELLAPGHAYRLHIQKECNVVDYKPPSAQQVLDDGNTTSQHASVTSSGYYYTTKADDKLLQFKAPYNGYQYNKPLFYLCETTDKHALSVLTVLDPAKYRPECAVSLIDDKTTTTSSSNNNNNTSGDAIDENMSSFRSTNNNNNNEFELIKTLPDHFPPHVIMYLQILHALDIECDLASDPAFSLTKVKFIPTEQIQQIYTKILNFNINLQQQYQNPTLANRRTEMIKLKQELTMMAMNAQNAAAARGQGPAFTKLPESLKNYHKHHILPPNLDHVYLKADTPLENGVPSFQDKHNTGYPCNATYDALLNLFQQYIPKHISTQRGEDLRQKRELIAKQRQESAAEAAASAAAAAAAAAQAAQQNNNNNNNNVEMSTINNNSSTLASPIGAASPSGAGGANDSTLAEGQPETIVEDEYDLSTTQQSSAIARKASLHAPSITRNDTYEASTTRMSAPMTESSGKKIIYDELTVKRDIRIAICGSSRFLQRIVTAYQKIRYSHPEIFDFLNPMFYLLPTSGDNHLANYISRHDLWYFRHIYTPLLSPTFVLPWLRDDPHAQAPMPGVQQTSYLCQYFRSCMAQYAQYSYNQLPVTVYKVECALDPRATEITTELYFIQRFELGIYVAIDEFRYSNQQYSGLSNNDVINHRDFKFNYLDMAIGYSKSDLAGHSESEILEDGVQFQHLILSNVPAKQTTKSTTSGGAANYLTEADVLAMAENPNIGGASGKSSKDDKRDAKKDKESQDKLDAKKQAALLVAQQNELLLATHSGGSQQNDITALPDPTTSTLELYISAPRVDKTKLRTNSLLADPKQHLCDIHFSSNTGFKIRLDGALYGPFKYVHVSPATTPLGELCKFPIQTFLPVTPGL